MSDDCVIPTTNDHYGFRHPPQPMVSASTDTRRRRMAMATVAVFLLFLYGEGAATLYLEYRPIPVRQNVLFGAQNGRDDTFVLQVDPEGGYVARSGDTSTFTDSAGTVFPRLKPENCIRVVCLGGSETYGVGADKDHSYPALLGRILNAALGGQGIRVEVVNAGFMGYHSWHSRMLMSLTLSSLSPDVVVILHGPNDLMNASVIRDLDEFKREQRDILGDPSQGRLSPARLLRDADQRLNLTVSCYRVLRHFIRTSPLFNPGTLTILQKLDLFGYADNVQAVIDQGRSQGYETVVLNYPWLVRPGVPDRSGHALLKAAPVQLYELGRAYFDAANKRLTADSGASLVDLMATFDALVDTVGPELIGKLYFDEVHLTKEGNILADKAIIGQLLRLPAFASRLTNVARLPIREAITLQHPSVFFKNGWPEAPNQEQPLVVTGMDNIRSSQDGPPGWTVRQPLDPAAPGTLTLRLAGTPRLEPLESNGLFNTFFYPRVAAASDSVHVLSATGEVLFSLAGPSGQSKWTGVSDKFGLNLPGGPAGQTLTVELRGKAQLWHSATGVFFTNDVAFPGY